MRTSYAFTKVINIIENVQENVVSFEIDNEKKCWIRNEELGKLSIQFIRRAVEEDRAIFVSYDAATGLVDFATHINKVYVETMEFIQQPKTGLKIQVVPRPAPLFLVKTNPRFDELRSVIENAKKNNQMLWVGTFPGDNDILDVQIPFL
ncbi:MAG: hypothetical protein PHP62_01090 [Candidatus Moranbacteria bacterium]|nr:hypothetical protein [Candidatus Moranbacteria bacterium]